MKLAFWSSGTGDHPQFQETTTTEEAKEHQLKRSSGYLLTDSVIPSTHSQAERPTSPKLFLVDRQSGHDTLEEWMDDITWLYDDRSQIALK